MVNLIPQVFYDFLGRIVPGFFLLVLLPLSVLGPKSMFRIAVSQSTSMTIPFFWQIALCLSASYMIGFVFGEVAEIVIGKTKKELDKQIEQKCKAECIEDHNRLEKLLSLTKSVISPEQLPRAFAMRDYLHDVAPGEAARLLKIRAERRLCQVLFLGGSMLGIINFLYLLGESSIDRIILELVLVFVIFFCWTRSKRLYRLYINGITISFLYYMLIRRLVGKPNVS